LTVEPQMIRRHAMSESHPRPRPLPAPPGCPLRGPALALLAGLALSACGEREEVWERARDVRGPLALAGHLAWIDVGLEQLVTVEARGRDGGGFDFAVARQPVGRSPVLLAASADGTQALVLTHGTTGGSGYAAEEERLYRLDPTGAAEPVAYELRSPFDALALSADGRWAVAYFATGAAVNPNELAVVRLDQAPAPDGNPRLVPVRTYGSRPLAVQFLQDLTIGDRDRQLGLVFSERYVTLIDLEQLDRRMTTVFLSARDSTDPVVPTALALAPGDATDPEGATPYVFLRAPGIAEVFALALKDNPDAEPDQNDFGPTVNEIPIPAPPDDFAVFDGPEGTLLLAVHRTPGVTVVDPRTTAAWNVQLDAGATRVQVFPEVPTRDGLRQLALLWAPGAAGQTRAGFLVLDDVQTRLRRNLETIDLGAPVQQVLPTGDPNRVLLVHDVYTGALSILDVADRTVEPLGISVSSGVLATHPQGRAFFFAAPGRAAISELRLDTGHAEELRLDAQPAGLYVLFGRIAGGTLRGRALVVDHGWSSGYLTALPLDAPSRSGAASLQGFLADGFLDIDAGRYPAEEVP
jgi:hypothetical protein